jgi:hypothetical protein
MRRLIVLLACIFALLVWALPAMAGPFTDVPTDHWAYDAIDKLQSEGFVEGYPDGTFRGNRSFTRYEMAMVIARIWDRLVSELETLKGMQGGVTREELDKELGLIRDLMNEFATELKNLGVRVDDLEKRMSSLEDRVSNLEKMGNSIKMSGALRTRIEDIVTNDYLDYGGFKNPAGAGQYAAIIAGTPGSRADERFEVEEKIQVALEAHPSDYLDVYMDLWQIASYLNAPKGNEIPPNAALVVDQAYTKADMMKLMGWTPTDLFNTFNLTVGYQYARFGVFGLAFDNGYETRPGIYVDLAGKNIELAAFLARNSRYGVQEGLGVARASYALGTSHSTVTPRDYFARIGFNYLGTGIGQERAMGADLDTELLSSNYLNHLKVEYLRMQKDQLGYDVSKSYGSDAETSIIAWVDLYNDGNLRASAAYADIGLVPGFSAIDNNPFEEYDYERTGYGANVNYAYESGINPFPSNFVGGGVQLEYTWWDVLNTRLTFFDGTNQDEEDLPVVIRLNISYPLSDASDIALEYIHSGIDALTLAKLRGEFLVRF